jgi:cyclohexanone monooxygenase
VVEATAEAEDAWVKQIVALAGFGAQAFLEQCTPGYYNREGKGAGGNMQNSPYAPGINAFNALLKDWRDADALDGMTIG